MQGEGSLDVARLKHIRGPLRNGRQDREAALSLVVFFDEGAVIKRGTLKGRERWCIMEG